MLKVILGCVSLISVSALLGCAARKLATFSPKEPNLRKETKVDSTAKDKIKKLEERLKEQSQQIKSINVRSSKILNRISTLEERVNRIGRETSVFEADYKSALSSYRNRKFNEAIAKFSRLLRRAPKHQLADNAQYWIAESYYGLEQYHQALAEFKKVFDYSETEKEDDAQLKIGYCYAKLGERTKALAEFRKFLSRYPNSEYLSKAEKMIEKLRED